MGQVQFSVIGSSEVPQPLRVTSDASDAVNANLRGSVDGETWLAVRIAADGSLRVAATPVHEVDAGSAFDVGQQLSSSGTLSTSGEVTVGSVEMARGARLVLRRILVSVGGDAVEVAFAIRMGATTVYRAIVRSGVCEIAVPGAPLVLEADVDTTASLVFEPASAEAEYGVITCAVLV